MAKLEIELSDYTKVKLDVKLSSTGKSSGEYISELIA